ncbi:uncharacterized protein LOC135400454 [Ornithodoros turicata]|uniref:uncharacterized protein LOC135400454 n=1 Tax=Ornithodoros turicata TaxID=34597 RepID=UPI0031388A31
MESLGLDDPVVNYFEQTVSKSDERYEVALPWRDHVNLNNNNEVAKRLLQQLTRKLQKAPVLLEAYDVAIRQYYRDDMAELVGEDAQTEHFTYYMPHQAVVREASSTTKLRVVFDASSHAPRSLSLNDNLQSGPNLTADLVALLLNFRQHNGALVADMEKAFLQIQVKESDRDSLRFLWYDHIPRPQEDTPNIVTFRMKRVPFGTTSSPFLFAATLKHHFENMAHKFPRSSKLLSESMYVDDLLTGSKDEEAALKLYEDANDIMTEASMKLHKWASNSKLLRERSETDAGDTKHLGYVAGVLKVLGLVWNPFEDKLGYTVDNVPSYDEEKLHTKRAMLKATASVYDPLGWVAPFLVRAKYLFQKLWVMEVDWDDVLPDGIDAEWKKWCSEVDKLRNIQVPRRYTESLPSRSCSFTLRNFADAGLRNCCVLEWH